MHPDQPSISANTVRHLVAAQFPEWSALPVEQVTSTGTVNALFRLGEGLAARFPWRPADVAVTRRWLQAEAGAARELLGRTPFATPEPVAIGEPGFGYPLPWSVQTWLPGTTAAQSDPAESTCFAQDLAAFVAAVRSIDRRGRGFTGSQRGGDLRSHDQWVQTCFEHSEGLLDVRGLRRMWAKLRDLPRTVPDVMTHGDLIAGNVLVADGRLTGVIDVGGLGPADPALDLVGAWHLLGEAPREVFRHDLGCDDLEWARGQAWAFEQAVGLVWYYRQSNPSMSRMGVRTLGRLSASASL